jgi:hypothetical protein
LRSAYQRGTSAMGMSMGRFRWALMPLLWF